MHDLFFYIQEFSHLYKLTKFIYFLMDLKDGLFYVGHLPVQSFKICWNFSHRIWKSSRGWFQFQG